MRKVVTLLYINIMLESLHDKSKKIGQEVFAMCKSEECMELEDLPLIAGSFSWKKGDSQDVACSTARQIPDL